MSCLGRLLRLAGEMAAPGRALATGVLALALSVAARAAVPPPADDMQAWFERFRQEASDEELYRFLYAMPKGGDLHNHLSGSILAESFYDLALAQAARGYRYYTRVVINNCRPYGGNRFSDSPATSVPRRGAGWRDHVLRSGLRVKYTGWLRSPCIST